ncbi:MAG: isochorismatase family protein [Acinetobacter sp.]
MSIRKIESYHLPLKQDYPAAKVDWKVDKQRAALLIHDMQDYFINFYGEDSPLIEIVMHNIGKLKAWCVQNDIPVYYTAQPAQQADEDRALLNDMWGAGLTAYPEQADIVKQLAPTKHDVVLTKWRYSAFYRSDFEQRLQQEKRDQLIICGVYAHIGVLQTAAEAFMKGIQPFVIADSVADFSLQDHLFALQYVQRNLGVVHHVNQLIRA